MLEFLGFATPTGRPPKTDPKTRKMQLLEFVRTLVRAGARDIVTVVLIEDLHWIDPASEEFIEALADAVVGTSTMLVVNFRPGFTAPLMQRSHYSQINMLPLASKEAQLLLQECCGDDLSLRLLYRNIIERAQGNPFFLEELVNAIVERGDFEGERGAYRLKGGIDNIPLPTTVQAVVAARIDRLDENAKNVLETAAVIGREFPLSILTTVAALPDAELSEALWHLRQAELLYDLPPYEQGLHAFRHPLIQEVAYRSLLQERRRTVHAAVAEAIQARDRSDERAGLLAYHLEQAGENLKAAQQNMRAAIWVGANDPSQALRSWKKVRELLMDQPSSKSNDYLRMMASGQIVNWGWREGMSPDDARIYYEEARQYRGRRRRCAGQCADQRRLWQDPGEWRLRRRVCRKDQGGQGDRRPGHRYQRADHDQGRHVPRIAAFGPDVRGAGDERRGDGPGQRDREVRPADAGL